MIIERHQDYQLRLGTIADGASVRRIPLELDRDAPFCLRGIGGYFFGGAPPFPEQLTGGRIQFSDAEGNWLQSAELGVVGFWNAFNTGTSPSYGAGGLDGAYTPIWRQTVYPPGSTISVNFTNNSGGPFPDTRIVFRGVKLFYRDQIWAPTYPSCFQSAPYDRVIRTDLAANETLREQFFRVSEDADFVFRYGMFANDVTLAGSDVGPLEIRLRDSSGKHYSNDFINARWLFARGDASVGGAAERPALWYPEIYIPRNELLYYDLRQNDVATASRAQFTFGGAKVFPIRG